jgi:hypothetical protein
MPDHDRSPDPMREIDLMLLENLMMRRNFQSTKTDLALQTTSMLLVLLGVGVIFAYSVTHPDVGAATMSQVADPSGALSISSP